MSEFQDKVVVITGAGGGLGREYALDLGKRGAKVVGFGRSDKPTDRSSYTYSGHATACAAGLANIEIMEALPTVILGFLAGLWLAPYVETHLAGIFTLLLILPIGFLVCAWLWGFMPNKSVFEGWEAALLIPVVLLLIWVSMSLSSPIETLFFEGDLRSHMSNEWGLNYDQRNALVVGLIMGFAVIPTIFSIAEDALFSVPQHLVRGSLALGATRWQTMTSVVLPAASPGIFSAVMMGFGRAVGETMIVLMATGNTPLMDMSIFQGMRTLAANLAVEVPEAEVFSTHYRVLFLAALILFREQFPGQFGLPRVY